MGRVSETLKLKLRVAELTQENALPRHSDLHTAQRLQDVMSLVFVHF